jgi:HEPN domain-containing protein
VVFTVRVMQRPLDREEYEGWRAEASRALRHGELATQDGLHNWACFSAEQSAQLAVKGLLHRRHPAGSPGDRYGSADAAQALDDARAVISLVDEAWDELDG